MNFYKCNSTKWALIYFIGAITQIGIICFCVTILRFYNIVYNSAIDLFFLAIGGLSSATWGVIVSRKLYSISYKEIIKDFFCIKQPLKYYLMILLYFFIIFGQTIIIRNGNKEVVLYNIIITFIQSILFGGIEEIGWRYTYQPLLEKKISFEVSCIITWLSWGVWHYMYFYFTNSLDNVNLISFFMGLLGTSFILGSIYRISNSLWLCVMYHALLNTFSQVIGASTFEYTVITILICIVIAIFLVKINDKKLHNYYS